VTAPAPRLELVQDVARLDQTPILLGDRLRRVLTALALTLDAHRAVTDRLVLEAGDSPSEGEEFAVLQMSAARCRDIVKSLESA
jgi:hypothetical protein